MSSVQIIFLISNIIWLIPPFANRKTGYFNYFYILALSDPLRIIIQGGFRVTNQFTMVFFVLMLLASLLNNKKLQKIVIAVSIVLSAISLIFNLPYVAIYWFSIVVLLGIVSIIAVRLIEELQKKTTLNLFLLLLLMYEAITIFRRIEFLLDPKGGTIGYFLGGMIQILFGLAFIFITIETKSLKLDNENTLYQE